MGAHTANAVPCAFMVALTTALRVLRLCTHTQTRTYYRRIRSRASSLYVYTCIQQKDVRAWLYACVHIKTHQRIAGASSAHAHTRLAAWHRHRLSRAAVACACWRQRAGCLGVLCVRVDCDTAMLFSPQTMCSWLLWHRRFRYASEPSTMVQTSSRADEARTAWRSVQSALMIMMTTKATTTTLHEHCCL